MQTNEMSEIAKGTISRASAQSKPVISEHLGKIMISDDHQKCVHF